MNDIKIFDNQEFGQIRTVVVNDEPMFAATDVAKALQYSNPAKAVIDHCKGVTVLGTPTFNQHGAEVMQNMKYINEKNLYRLIMHSKAPKAEQFQDWVYDEVLPSIRKSGGYMATNGTETDAELMARALMVAQETMKRRDDRIKELESKTNEQQQFIEAQNSQIHELTSTVVSMEQKVSYLDTILMCKSTVKTKVIAQDYGMSAIAFNQLLHSRGIQYKCGDSWLLYAKYLSEGYVKDVPFKYENSDGQTCIKSNMQWTQKGRLFLYGELKRANILPLIERL